MMINRPLYKAASREVLADAYNVSLRTFKKWIAPINEHLGSYIGRVYTPKQVSIIVELLGEPEKIELVRAV